MCIETNSPTIKNCLFKKETLLKKKMILIVLINAELLVCCSLTQGALASRDLKGSSCVERSLEGGLSET